LQREISLSTLQQYDPDTTHLVTDERHAYYLFKRVFDFSVAFFLLILLSPLLLLIAAAIFVYSPGPIFFVQERWEQKGRSTMARHAGKEQTSVATSSER
jgi:putative colanic acid biosynthesis UDP-glucose lipid carrier transferase